MRKFKIADLIIEIDYPDYFIAESFYDFECSQELETDIYWTMVEETAPRLPRNGRKVVYSGFTVVQKDEKVYVKYKMLNYHIVHSMVYEEHYRHVTIYLPEHINESDTVRVQQLKMALLAYHREMFLLALLNYKGISIHSASIIYKGYGLVFSAKSGTGKSTHTNLWKQYYDTPILDGDVTVCRMTDKTPYIYGLPWSGSSNLYLNQRVELKAVIFLSQGRENQAEQIGIVEMYKRWLSRSFTSRWFSDMIQEESKILQEILSHGVLGLTLSCDISKEAVDSGKKFIDQIISE